MKRFLLLLALASMIFISGIRVSSAAGAITVSDTSVKVDYPKQMTFHLATSSSAPIIAIGLAVRFPNGLVTRLQPKFDSANQVDTSIQWNLNGRTGSSTGGYLPPGASGEFSWHIEDQAGNKIDTPFAPFQVQDNREQWKVYKNDRVTLYWGAGSQEDGQTVFDTANKTLDAIQNDVGATLTAPVKIYAWGSRDDFTSALSPGNQEWAGGTIDSDFWIVLIDASEGMNFVIEATPHELTHLVIAQYLKGPYGDITMPLWMNEGMAVYHEYIPPKDEPRFDIAVRRGIQTDTLFRLRSLDGRFPSDSSVVEMAYGQGYSVVDFMIKTYGRDKLRQVMTLFKNGTIADEAFKQVLGVDEDGLENAWRKSIGAQVKNYAKAPTVTPGSMPTLSFSSAGTPSSSQPSPTEVAQDVTPILSPNSAPTPPPAQGGGGGGLCGLPIGAMGLVAFGAWRLGRRKRSG